VFAEFFFSDWFTWLAEVAISFTAAFSDNTWFFLGQVLHVFTNLWARSWVFLASWWFWPLFRDTLVGFFSTPV
jgi:hypothetical protein